MSFSEYGIDKRLLEALNELEITKPTPIQVKSIPEIQKGKNVLGIAPTGTGKTIAFLLPSLNWLYKAKIPHQDPSILILLPTRELVAQMEKNLKELTKNTEVTIAKIVAGESEAKQKKGLKGIVDIVIATSGRLQQFIEEETVNLSNISILIIDEVDRMLDLGFKEEVMDIISHLPHKNKRQTLLFCSTIPKQVENFSRQLQLKPLIVEIARSTSPIKISHEVYEVEDKEKFDVLIEVLKSEKIVSAIIFTRSQDTARITSRNLLKAGLEIEEMHGGLTQIQRNRALQNFTDGSVDVLVATDIASRGIDIDDISHIISFDVPSNFDDYIHRSGRTGRINRAGKSIILASRAELAQLTLIKNRLKDRIVTIREIPKQVKIKPKKKAKRMVKLGSFSRLMMKRSKEERKKKQGHRKFRKRKK